MTEYRKLKPEEVKKDILKDFIRRQEVKRCWRKENGEWKLKDIAFVDDWSEEERAELAEYIKKTAENGGLAVGAFFEGRLKGFVTVEKELIGSKKQYADLTNIHVSEDMRRKGIGKELFNAAKSYGRELFAEKLYISAHSSEESMAFYKAMGCAYAEEYSEEHVKKEPCDCQLELKL